MTEKELEKLKQQILDNLDKAFGVLEEADEEMIFFLIGTHPELLKLGTLDCVEMNYSCPMMHKSQLVKVLADALVKLEPNLGLLLEEFYRNSPEKPLPEESH